MTREEAIEYIKYCMCEGRLVGNTKPIIDEKWQAGIMAIKALKQACWIPVSEKLPKSKPEDLEYPTVIICLSDGTVELGCFYESTKEWGAGENFDRLRNPIAWMPLPDPYEKESGGEE